MHILLVTSKLPMPDRASGDLRFFSIIKSLSKDHTLTLAIYDKQYQLEITGITAYQNYEEDIVNLGVDITSDCQSAIRNTTYDCIFFEFYHSVSTYIQDIRLYKPHVKVIIDSVDIHFNRLDAKAQLTQLDEDYNHAKDIKKEEIGAYALADLIITVTNKDKDILTANYPAAKIAVIPNIHDIPIFQSKRLTSPLKLLFVGGFQHPPNIDAINYFCQDIYPLVLKQHPDTVLTIVGSNPTDAVLDLACDNVIVTGHVPSVIPYYKHTDIVVAPLRYGGGMKGKIGEAFSLGAPVVTTNFGVEGMDAQPDVHFMLANTPSEFCCAIDTLVQTPTLYQAISESAWKFVSSNYSPDITDNLIAKALSELDFIKVKKLPLVTRVKIHSKQFLNQHVLWRFNKSV